MLGHDRSLVWGDERCAAAAQDAWLWQDKTSVVARNKGTTKGGGRRRRPPPLCGGGRRPPPLSLATTEVLSCHNRHLVLPQRTSRVATREIRRIAFQRRMMSRCYSVITRRWWLRSGHLWGQNELQLKARLFRWVPGSGCGVWGLGVGLWALGFVRWGGV